MIVGTFSTAAEARALAARTLGAGYRLTSAGWIVETGERK